MRSGSWPTLHHLRKTEASNQTPVRTGDGLSAVGRAFHVCQRVSRMALNTL